MFDKANFGQYIAQDSFIHKLDPRIKFLSLIVFIVAIVMLHSWQVILSVALLTLVLFFSAKLRLKDLFNSLKPLLPLLTFAFALNLFVPQAGDELLWQWKFLRISNGSILNAFNMSLRISSLILISNLLLSLTTSASDLSNGLSSLLSPLNKLGLPVQDMGMMMSIALRFIPSLMQETDQLMKAQSSRGANYDTGGLVKRLRGLVTIMVPLFISSFRKAEILAEAMEARAYRSDVKRGKLYPLKIQSRDIVFFVMVCIFLPLLVVLDRSLR